MEAKQAGLTPFGLAVKKRLIDRNMTQAELAARLGCNKQYLHKILIGERSGKKYIGAIVKILEIQELGYRGGIAQRAGRLAEQRTAFEEAVNFRDASGKQGTGQKLYISMYHYIRNLKHSRYPGIKGLDIDLFQQQLAFFKENFNVVRMEQVIEAVKGKETLPEKALLLTFDDGYIDNFTAAFPLLEEYGLQGSFFVPGKVFTTHQMLDVNKIHHILAVADSKTLVADVRDKMDFYRGREFDYPSTGELWKEYAVDERFDGKDIIFVKRMLQTVLPEQLRGRIIGDLFEKYVGVTEEQLAYELYMTREQIRTLKRHGMYIGIHGYDHYWLGNLSRDRLQEEISMALDVMDEFIDKACWVMNYPYGDYNADVLKCIKSLGAVIGLTTDVNVAEIGKDNALELPRLDCNDFPPKSDNYVRFEGECLS